MDTKNAARELIPGGAAPVLNTGPFCARSARLGGRVPPVGGRDGPHPFPRAHSLIYTTQNTLSMPVTIEYRIDASELRIRTDVLARRISTLGDVLKASAQDIRLSVLERWDREESPDGAPWQSLAAATLARKKDARKLIEGDVLRKSITVRPSTRKTNPSLRMGSNLVYARIHQLGGEAGRGLSVTIPARPYLGFSDEDRERVRRDLLKSLQRLPTMCASCRRAIRRRAWRPSCGGSTAHLTMASIPT